MASPDASRRCRACGAELRDHVLDLGLQPDPDRLLDIDDPQDAPVAPVDAWICARCGLLQLVGARPPGGVPPHGHGPSIDGADTSWIDDVVTGLGAGRESRLAIDVDVADERLLGAFATRGFRTIALHGDIGELRALREAGERASVVIASHALAHVDDPDRSVDAIASVLTPDGVAIIEFHHCLGIADGQFDVLSHAHRSYFSLTSMAWLLDRTGLTVFDAHRMAAYGGSIRLLAGKGTTSSGDVADAIRALERRRRLDEAAGYTGLPDAVERATADLRRFLEDARAAGRSVVGYGAAARGTVLLNLAGIRPGLLPFTVDRSVAKQGRLLPGARIPVRAPDEIARARPDDILILPWPLVDEIAEQLSPVRAEGVRLVVAMPTLTFR
jgi:SAM-dependent methyltransferase